MGKCNTSSMVPGVHMFSTWSFPIPSPECGEPSHDNPRPSLLKQEKRPWNFSPSFPICTFMSCCSAPQSCPTLWLHDCSTPGFPVLHHLPELAQTHVHWIGDAIRSFHPLCPLLLLPTIFPSIGSFLMRWVFISGGQSIGGLASVLPIQGWVPFGLTDLICSTRDSPESSPAPQFSHPYVTAGKNVALTIQNFVGKVISLLFNTLSRFVIIFLPRSKRLLISWLQSPSALILEPQKIKSVSVCTFSPSICHEVMGLDAMILVSWMLSFKPVVFFSWWEVCFFVYQTLMFTL